MKGGMRLRR